MKNSFLVIIAFLLVTSAAQAQFSIGIKGGVNSQVNKPDDIVVPGDGGFDFGVKNFKFGTQFGAYVRLGNKVFIQPELVFNSNRTDYVFHESSVGEVIKNEKYQFLDLPVLVGFSTGPIRLSAGPVGHYFLNSTSELTDYHGYSSRFKEMTWGWQGGLTIGRGRFSADIRYEGNFSKSGDHINFFGNPYHFSNNPSRIILGLNIALIK